MSNHTISDLGKRSVDSKTAENNPARCGAGEVAGRASSSKSDCYKFGTWNVRSLFQVGKLAGIVQEMERTDLDLLGISETFCNDSGEFKTIRKECKKAKEKYYGDKCKELEELDAKHSPRLFTKLKELKERKNNAKSGQRNRDGQVIQDANNILKRWHEYTTELYSDDRGKVPKIDVDEEAQKVPYIPETEILKAITQLPKNKAVGEDNIPAEFLQCLGEKGKKKIITIINKIYQNGEIPADFLKSIFIPLPKTVNTTKCEEHRTASLIPHVIKILLYIIKKQNNSNYR